MVLNLGSGHLGNDRTILSYVNRLTLLRGDRFFAVVANELRDEIKHGTVDGLFDSVSGSLHRPPPGFREVGSFKTDDAYGNLQLTFFTDDDSYVADIDIDDAGGLGHVFQVLRNSLTGRPTHPYNIHQLLVHHQQIDPAYAFSFRV